MKNYILITGVAGNIGSSLALSLLKKKYNVIGLDNFLTGKKEKLPNVFNKTTDYFKKHKDCVLVFIRDSNLKSVSETLRSYKSKKFYSDGKDKLIRNYGIGAQIIKALKIKNMILVTRSKKKVVGLDGYGIKITKQEIIK